jgi:hypothetical protein
MVNIHEQFAVKIDPLGDTPANSRRKYYAGIGSRETPIDVCVEMTRIATILENAGYVLRSGRGKRADEAFEAGVKNPANKEIFDPRHERILISKGARDLVRELHPNPEAAMKYIHFLGRSAYQILGVNLDSPVEFVICWSIKGELIGGTAMGMRIAMKYKIPIHNMYRMSGQQVLDAAGIGPADQSGSTETARRVI